MSGVTIPATCINARRPGLPATHRESTALGVCEPKRSRTKLFAEDAILFSEIVNHIFLVAIHPASNSEHEELQRMGHRERLLGGDAWHRTAATIHLASAAFSHLTGTKPASCTAGNTRSR